MLHLLARGALFLAVVGGSAAASGVATWRYANARSRQQRGVAAAGAGARVEMQAAQPSGSPLSGATAGLSLDGTAGAGADGSRSSEEASEEAERLAETPARGTGPKGRSSSHDVPLLRFRQNSTGSAGSGSSAGVNPVNSSPGNMRAAGGAVGAGGRGGEHPRVIMRSAKSATSLARPKSLDELGALTGVTTERVQQRG